MSDSQFDACHRCGGTGHVMSDEMTEFARAVAEEAALRGVSERDVWIERADEAESIVADVACPVCRGTGLVRKAG